MGLGVGNGVIDVVNVVKVVEASTKLGSRNTAIALPTACLAWMSRAPISRFLWLVHCSGLGINACA